MPFESELTRESTIPAGRGRTRRPRLEPTWLALAAILALALGLRLWSLGHGLPFVFNPDEELHFVPPAVEMIGRGSLNPGYFENPPALTYLLHLVFRLRFGAGFPFGGEGFVAEFRADPEAAYMTARVVVALLGALAVALVYWAGARFFDRATGLVAAALIAVAFLPVYYSKQALNDAVAMAPVAAALVLCLVAWRRGRALDWALAGAMVGVATAVKYTAGAMVVLVALAALYRLRAGDDSPRAALRGLAIAAAAYAAAFLALNPYSLLDLSEFRSQLRGQGAQGATAKLGQDDVPGWLYYLWTLTWGFGWLPALAAVGGAAVALRRDPRKALMLVAFPLVLWLVLGGQGRFFGRWLLPAYPMLAILAAYGAVWLARAVPLPRWAPPRAWRPALVAVLAAALCAQGVFASVHIARVQARADTRELAHEWLYAHVPAGSRIVVEPFIPEDFLTVGGRTDPDRYVRWPVRRPYQAYEKKLTPGVIDLYRRGGYCWVVAGSTQKQRGLKEGLPGATAYYRRLDAESAEKLVFSPYSPGADPVEFNYDLSFNYLPRAYRRPGPLIEIHRLRDCDS